ncbi:MAG: hypothetical protein QOK21_4456, partial [Solirubrobacteraceae bacterium]|nr:hypothetical protein [Solirubrobacteraceae bacterium]
MTRVLISDAGSLGRDARCATTAPSCALAAAAGRWAVGCRAPATLGTFLRAFTFGHVASTSAASSYRSRLPNFASPRVITTDDHGSSPAAPLLLLFRASMRPCARWVGSLPCCRPVLVVAVAGHGARWVSRPTPARNAVSEDKAHRLVRDLRGARLPRADLSWCYACPVKDPTCGPALGGRRASGGGSRANHESAALQADAQRLLAENRERRTGERVAAARRLRRRAAEKPPAA